MSNRTEQEVMKNWCSRKIPVVSICCITYNQEKFINEAIDSFLMQETDFPFEILVRDDYSTDNTASIVKKYADTYPNIIKPIFEKENQFSKGVKAMPVLFNKAVGKYIALCEGDDYWLDKNKLQTQIDEMKKYPGCSMSFHPARELNGNECKKILSKHFDKSKIFTTSDIISGFGGFCPTASLIFKKDVLINLPEWFYKKAPVGDYYYQIFGSIPGGALYINKIMCIYRVGHTGSWTSNLSLNSMPTSEEVNNTIKKQKKFIIRNCESLTDLNEYLDNKYKNEINKIKAKQWYSLALFSLKNANYVEYKKSIEYSYKIFRINTLEFLFYYNFRCYPIALNYILKLYSIVKIKCG